MAVGAKSNIHFSRMLRMAYSTVVASEDTVRVDLSNKEEGQRTGAYEIHEPHCERLFSALTSSLSPLLPPILIATSLPSLSSSTSWRKSVAIVSENTRMSFTATPLDQNRRVDRNTFFNKQAQNQQARLVPASYSFG